MSNTTLVKEHTQESNAAKSEFDIADFLSRNNDKRTKCLVYTRVMGYHRPVESFNIGKKGEHKERRFFEHL